jgi:hypothetical protein
MIFPILYENRTRSPRELYLCTQKEEDNNSSAAFTAHIHFNTKSQHLIHHFSKFSVVTDH